MCSESWKHATGPPRAWNKNLGRRSYSIQVRWWLNPFIKRCLQTQHETTESWITIFMIIFSSEDYFPGRNLLGKRRYFSGIVALRPLTPLTYKQNAVNAFIPTSKTPLTPLYQQGAPLTPLAFRLNAVNAVIPEKTCLFKKSDFLTPWRMRNSWSIMYLTKDYEAFRAYTVKLARAKLLAKAAGKLIHR